MENIPRARLGDPAATASTCSSSTTRHGQRRLAGRTSLKELGTGLVDAMREHGLDPMAAAEKGDRARLHSRLRLKAPVEEQTTTRINQDGSITHLREDGSEFIGVPARLARRKSTPSGSSTTAGQTSAARTSSR